VDDIVLAVPTSKIDFVFKKFNSIHPKLQFTIEIGKNSINFLDTTIIIKDKKILFNWFHKPTFSGRYLNYWSQHSLSQKKDIIMGLVDRTFLLSHPEFHQKKILNSLSKYYWRMIIPWISFLIQYHQGSKA